MERQLFDWLRAEFAVDAPSQKLLAFWKLDEPGFLAELRNGRAKLSKAELQRVRDEFASTQKDYLPLLARSRELERKLHQAVLEAYDLTPKEIELVRRTTSPRDPLALLDAES